MFHPPSLHRLAPQHPPAASATPRAPLSVWRSGLALALASLAFAGCEPLEGRKLGPDAAASGAASGAFQASGSTAASSGSRSSSASAPRLDVAHDWVNPRFVPMGPAGGLPTGLVVEFGRPINDDDDELDRWSLGFSAKPAVDIRADFVTPSTLRLRFANDLAPDTQYSFAITSVPGDQGQIAPKTPWTHTLVTPPFGLLGVRLGYAAPGRGNVVLYARFSAQPDLNHVRKHIELTVDGQPIKPESVHFDGREVEIRLASPRIVTGAKVSVAFAAGISPAVTTAQSVALPALPAETLLVGASTPLEMQGVMVAERPSGMGLVVHCDDPASGPTELHWTSNYAHRTRSPRCLPDETVLARYLRLDPAVPYTVKSDEAGFRIEAEFKRGPVTLSLAAGMPTIDGGHLEKAYTATVKVPARTAQVHIAAEGRYLPRGNWQALPVSLLNAARLRLRVRRVPPENLAAFLNDYDEEDPDEVQADLIVNTVIEGFEGPQDRAHDAWVDLNQHLPDPAPGVYAVDLTAMAAAGGDGADEDDDEDDEDDEYAYRRRRNRDDHSHAARRLVISDLQIVTKTGTTADGSTDQWHVHVLDAHTLRSVSGVEVSLLRKSGTALSTCKTAGDNGCTVSAPTGTDSPAISARKGNDYTYLDLDRLQTSNDSAETYGKPYRASQPYTLAPFTNRGVWRPGERVHAGVLVRGVDLKAPPAGLPVALKLVDARYNQVRVHTGVTDAAGLVTYEVPIPESGLTGTWRAEFEVAGDELAQLTLPIEDIVPERMAVTVKPAAAWVGPGAPARFKVSARYLFGGDATGSEVTAECRFQPKRLSPPGVEPELQFGALVDAEHDLGELSATLGADGLDLDCPLPPNAPDGVVSIQVSVMEAGSGRATRGGAWLKHHAAPLAVGLRAPVKPIKAGEPTEILGAVLNWDGTPATGELSVRVERLDPAYGWHLSAEDGEVWSRHLRATEVLKVNLKPDAKGRFAVPFTTDTDAEGYVAYAEVGASKAKLALEGAQPAFAWRGADDWERADATRTPQPNQVSDVPLHTPKEVEVGRAAEATFEAPFAGRALLSIETDRLESARWVDVVAGNNRWPFKITRFAPNMYLSVLVVKNPHLESKDAWLPDRALGVQSVRVIPQGQVLNPKLTVTAELRPGMPMVVQVDAGLSGRDAAMLDGVVVVSVVDEGILQLTRFKTPDPNADLLASRALAVETYETFGWGLRLASRDRRSASGGGDDGDDAGLDDRAVVEPLAIWSGPIALDARGKAEVKLDLPRHTGKLRVMAVMADRARVGVAESFVQVRDPLAMLATAPLFARRGDRIELPVFLSNLTGAAADVKISVAVEGGVAFTGADGKALTGPQSKTVSLAADEGHTAVFGARVIGMSGQARVRITATGGGVESHDELRIDLRPEGALERRTQTVAMTAGAPLDLTAHLDRDFLAGTEQIGVRLAADETEDALDHLRSLARYPHGCLEQTTSQARPLLALGTLFDDLSPGLNPSLGATRRLQNQAGLGLDDLVKAGIERVLALQTSGGGFAYWSGGTEPHYWGSTQAILFLMDAKAAGYAVQPGRIESALAWMTEHLDSEDVEDDGRGHATEAWMHYTLARAGQAEKARIAQTLEAAVAAAPDAAPSETVTLLRAALYLAGDRRYADDLKAPVVADIGQSRVLAGDFWSELRERAVETSIFIELFGADPAGRGRVESLAKHLRGQASRGYTTSELSWSLYAVARWRQASAANLPAVNLTAAAQPVAPQRPGSGAFWLPAPPTGSALVLSAAAGMNVPPGTRVVLTQEGVRPPEKAWRGAEGLAVTRSIVDGDGKPVDLARVRLGQLVYVRLDLKNLGRESIPNVALVDPLPGGLAVENARLFGAGDAKAVKGERTGWMPEHLDLRDDRVAAFGTLAPEAQVSLVYTVRAVVAGTWQAPGAEVEAMYDPRLRARNAPGEITVIAPWTERM